MVKESRCPLTIGEACFKRIMSFLVLREWEARNRWRDGQVCPDVGQGILASWARRPRRRKKRGDGRERSPALDGEKEKALPWMEKA
ncbi:hypothetical protein TNCV_3721321 [Trichonephila clavipes]|nr:hypothetical protein TNCV_3721321 [Trichonephila clavipes]